MVADVLDMGQSDEGMMVAYGVCRELDDMKNTYNSLPDYLTKVRLAGNPCTRAARLSSVCQTPSQRSALLSCQQPPEQRSGLLCQQLLQGCSAENKARADAA